MSEGPDLDWAVSKMRAGDRHTVVAKEALEVSREGAVDLTAVVLRCRSSGEVRSMVGEDDDLYEKIRGDEMEAKEGPC